MSNNDTAIIIPARYGSSRFPGKPLAMLAGKTMLERVWRNACAAIRDASLVYIATDDERIKVAASNFGAQVVMTPVECENGSERVFAVSQGISQSVKFFINLQGDSPLVPPALISSLIELRRADDSDIATLSVQLSSADSFKIRSGAKKLGAGTYVVFNCKNRALYFSRYPIPFVRDQLGADTPAVPLFKHVGIYAYSRSSLQRYLELPASGLEDSEKLEQLRALEAGMTIAVKNCDLGGRTLVSVDTPEDLAQAEAVIASEGELIA